MSCFLFVKMDKKKKKLQTDRSSHGFLDTKYTHNQNNVILLFIQAFILLLLQLTRDPCNFTVISVFE